MGDAASKTSSKTLDMVRSKWVVLLALLLLIVGIPLSFWMPYQRQRWALQAIEAAGAKVSVELGPGGPDWLRNIIGDAAMQVFDQPKRIAINEPPPQFGDEDLQHLAGLTTLQFLYLDNTQAGDMGLRHLAGLTELRYLVLSNTQVSNEGLKHLVGLTKLERLYLNNSQVRDEGLKHVEGLTVLDRLLLANTQVSDEGLQHLAGLTKLRYLDLSNTHVSDEGLKHLVGLTILDRLLLTNTQVSNEGVARLRAALPNCEITVD